MSLVLVAAAIAVAAPAVATSEPPDAGDAVRVVETLHGPVEVPATPERVVAISYETPWQMQAAGVRPVGVIDYSAWIDSYTTEQQAFIDGIAIVGDFGTPNYEAIAALDPDLIIGDAYEMDELAHASLSAIAPTVLVSGRDRGDWRATSTMTAEALGAIGVLEAAIADYEAEVARLRDEYVDVLAMEWIHFSLGNAESEFSIQYPTGVIGDLIFNELGATLAASVPDIETPAGYESFSKEQIGDLLGGADILVYFENPDGSVMGLIQAVIDAPLFGSLSAAQAGNVVGVCCSVTDYVTARDYLLAVEERVLAPFAAAAD